MPKPVLPSHDSASYELLSLTALCGEFPCDSAARLISSESYRKKIVTGLTHNRLLRIFSRNHLRGYRLGIRGKRLLQDQEPERFLFYLSGCGDTNAIKSEPSRRLRLHRIARTYITMKNAGITIFRDKKPPLFSPDTAGAIPIEDVYFYDSREMKELRSEMLKIYGSRMTGALFTPKQAFAVFNAMDSIPTFDPQIERRAKVMLQRVCQIRTVATRKVDGILLADHCGTISELSRRISVIRSRNISMSCVFQNLAGLQNRYPQNQWQEILGNCDVQLFLGCTDQLTAEYVSQRTGIASVMVSSTSKALNTLRVSDYTPQYRESNGIGKRPLLTPDEVLRLPVDEALVILRGHKVLKVHKMDYSLHPAYKHLRECKASAHIPEWQTAVPETPSAITPSTAPIAKTPPKWRGRKAKTVVAADKTSIMTKPENEKELSHGNEQ